MTLFLADAQAHGSPIIANYSLRFPSRLVRFGDIVKLTDAELEDAYIGTDELNIGADSYEFFTRQSTKLAYLTTQLRKNNNTWIFATTRFRLIALRIRQQVDAFIIPSDDDARFVNHKILDVNRKPLYCKGQFHAKLYDGDMQLIREIAFDATKIWDAYDTNERIRV